MKASKGFTLVELMAAAAVVAVGMVFVLGAFSQCLSAFSTAQGMIRSSYILNAKAWETDADIAANNGSEPGEWTARLPVPDDKYTFTRVVHDGIRADFGNASLFLQENLNEEELTVSWIQGRAVKNISVVRYVKKKKE